MGKLFALFAMVLSMLGPAALAQNATLQPSASAPATGAPSASAPATHLRVDDGVFQLGDGQSIDLTDRRILFAMTANRSYRINAARASTSINGKSQAMNVGDRLDLKVFKPTKNFLTDKNICFIDFLRTEKALGDDRFVAVFRFFCE